MIGQGGGGVDLPTTGSPVPPDTAPSGAGAPSRRGRTPVRTCVGCRGQGERSALVRVVVVDGLLVPDPRARAAGRGAWLHPDPACLDLAERRRALPRALRVPGPLDTRAVRDEIARQHDQHHQN
ncbi:MAG: YlxR family protein [Candidatus Nanopelagicales bacterium]